MTVPADVVHACTEHLATGSFGDSAALLHDIDTLLDGLTLVHGGRSPNVPTARGVSRTLARGALHSATRGVLSQLPPLESAEDTLPAGSHLLALRPARSARVNELANLAVSLLAKDGYRAQVDPDDVALDATAQVTAAIDHLMDVVSPLAAAALPHASLVAFMTGSFQSVYLADLPELIILNPHTIGGSVHLGELLLHESLHQKFYDMLLVRHVSGRATQPPVQFEIPWGRVGGAYRTMDALRLLSTFHVYVHLCAYRLAVDHVQPSAEPSLTGKVEPKFDTYVMRAQFFQHVLSTTEVIQHLGHEAPQVVEWLGEALSTMVPLHQANSSSPNRYISFADHRLLKIRDQILAR